MWYIPVGLAGPLMAMCFVPKKLQEQIQNRCDQKTAVYVGERAEEEHMIHLSKNWHLSVKSKAFFRAMLSNLTCRPQNPPSPSLLYDSFKHTVIVQPN